jgi:hypothetical protein
MGSSACKKIEEGRIRGINDVESYGVEEEKELGAFKRYPICCTSNR